MKQANTLPLNGISVLEFGHTVMGPTCGLILADMGAEAIKIEENYDFKLLLYSEGVAVLV